MKRTKADDILDKLDIALFLIAILIIVVVIIGSWVIYDYYGPLGIELKVNL